MIDHVALFSPIRIRVPPVAQLLLCEGVCERVRAHPRVRTPGVSERAAELIHNGRVVSPSPKQGDKTTRERLSVSLPGCQSGLEKLK